MWKVNIFGLGIVLASFSCKMDKRVERSAYEEELKSREIIKVTEAEFFDAALEWGNEISENTQKTLAGNLQKAIQQDGIEGAINYCNLKADPLVDSLQKHFSVEIKRTSQKLRNKDNAPDSLENAILEAYSYNFEKGLPLEENIQRIEGEVFLYNKPIVINNPVCLNCHGNINAEVPANVNALLLELYPADSAVGYKMNDLRGMWSIRIPQKELIRHAFQ